MTTVEMKWPEWMNACQAGCMRRLSSAFKGRVESFINGDRFDFNGDIIGALGEMAVAKVLGLYWDASINTFSAPDLAHFQIRACTNPDDPYLNIKKKDKDREIFIQVLLVPKMATVGGWMFAHEAKHPEYWRDKNTHSWCRLPSWFVPVNHLRPLSTLPKKGEENAAYLKSLPS